MRHLKIMRHENTVDHDSRKSHRIVSVRDEDEISFDRLWDGTPHVSLTNRRERGLWQYFPRGNTYLVDENGKNVTSFGQIPLPDFYYTVPQIKSVVDWCVNSLEGPTLDREQTERFEIDYAFSVFDVVRRLAHFMCPSLPGPLSFSWETIRGYRINEAALSALLLPAKSQIPFKKHRTWPKYDDALAETGPDLQNTVEHLDWLATYFNEACVNEATLGQFLDRLNDVFGAYLTYQCQWSDEMANGHQY